MSIKILNGDFFNPNRTIKSKGNWKQRILNRKFSIISNKQEKSNKISFIKKNLIYTYFLKTFLKNKNSLCLSNIKFLLAFIGKYGKIKSRRKTHINLQVQKKIAKLIKQSRMLGLVPFKAKIVVTKMLNKTI